MRSVIEKHLLNHWPRLFGYAVSLTGDRESAKDLLQQCAMQALSTGHPPRDESRALPWLFRVVRNAWFDNRRRDAVRSTDAEPELIEAEIWRYSDQLITVISVKQGLARVDPMQREVIQLVDVQGFSYAEAAEVLDIPIGTVMSRLSRARLALLDAIGGNVRTLKTRREGRS